MSYTACLGYLRFCYESIKANMQAIVYNLKKNHYSLFIIVFRTRFSWVRTDVMKYSTVVRRLTNSNSNSSTAERRLKNNNFVFDS